VVKHRFSVGKRSPLRAGPWYGRRPGRPWSDQVEFCILGPLEARVDGVPIPLGAPKQRALLALLVLHANTVVSVDRLVDGLWGDSPPPTAAKIVQVYVSGLRRALRSGGEEALLTRAPGYLLQVPPEALDLERFERLVERARGSAADEPAVAAGALREALALWRGAPLADVAFEPFAAPEVMRLEERRLEALEARIDADLALGRHAELVGELRALADEHPYREGLHARLILALYRSGRQVEALESYREARRLLMEELGIEPSPELARLEVGILRHEPGLAPPQWIEGATPPARRAAASLVALLERDEYIAELERCFRDTQEGTGRLALVAAEAGGGKTALVERFCAERVVDAQVLWGACDPLSTPRALGPLLDVAAAAGGELARLARESADREAIFDALLARLRGARGSIVLVIEDAHWADEASLDCLRFLGRRLGQTPTLLIVTYRHEEIGPRHPLRTVLGDLATASVVRRLSLPPLSPAAVATLAGRRADEPGDLHALTGGNPFFVTEVLATPGAEVPETVRDAVLARASRLSPAARRALDAASIVPLRVEPWLLAGLCDCDIGGVEECVAVGMLVDLVDGLAFRHELARLAVEEAVPRRARVDLHRRIVALLTEPPEGAADPARLAHHAEAAGLGAEVVRYAPLAAARAAALGAHREAAAQYARALRFGRALAPAEQLELLQPYAYECYLTNQTEEAVEAERRAVEGWRALGKRRGEGDGLRRLSRYLWYSGRRKEAEAAADAAVALLETLEPGPELARAYSEVSRLCMLAQRTEGAVTWGMRAIALAERLGATEIVIYALNNVGSAENLAGIEAGREKLERSLTLALDAGLEEEVARAYNNLGSGAAATRRHALAERWLKEGIAYCEDHELDGFLAGLRFRLAETRLAQGCPDEAESLIGSRVASAYTRSGVPGLRGLLRARRGDLDAWPLLDQALEAATSAGELQMLGPIACQRAEAAWIAGDDLRAAAEARRALPLALEVGDVWRIGELASWMRRAGAASEIPSPLIEPYSLEQAGRWREAAAAWDALGCPYEAALSRGETDDAAIVGKALRALEEVGAPATATRVACRARERGVQLPRGLGMKTRPTSRG
jgi:DNA-binding SARP family transcriptional activator